MICTARWFDSHDRADRTVALALWMDSADDLAGVLFENERESPDEVWPPARRFGIGTFSFAAAAELARHRGLVRDADGLGPFAGERAADELEQRPAHSGSRRLEVLREQAPHLIAETPTTSPAELAAAVVDGLAPQVSRETLLELHGALVVLPTANPIIDALLTELERAYMSRGGAVAAS